MKYCITKLLVGSMEEIFARLKSMDRLKISYAERWTETDAIAGLYIPDIPAENHRVHLKETLIENIPRAANEILMITELYDPMTDTKRNIALSSACAERGRFLGYMIDLPMQADPHEIYVERDFVGTKTYPKIGRSMRI